MRFGSAQCVMGSSVATATPCHGLMGTGVVGFTLSCLQADKPYKKKTTTTNVTSLERLNTLNHTSCQQAATGRTQGLYRMSQQTN